MKIIMAIILSLLITASCFSQAFIGAGASNHSSANIQVGVISYHSDGNDWVNEGMFVSGLYWSANETVPRFFYWGMGIEAMNIKGFILTPVVGIQHSFVKGGGKVEKVTGLHYLLEAELKKSISDKLDLTSSYIYTNGINYLSLGVRAYLKRRQ